MRDDPTFIVTLGSLALYYIMTTIKPFYRENTNLILCARKKVYDKILDKGEH